MSNIVIRLTTDTQKWEEAVANWSALAHSEGVLANSDAAKVIQDRARRLLDEGWHAPGTRSPKPPGTAPGSITGLLADSITVSRDGDDALVGPTDEARSKNGPYGRFLELGGEHIAHSGSGGYYDGEWWPSLMWWREDGKEYRSPHLTKAPRPYLKTATEEAIASGEITDQYYRHWLLAQEMI